MFNNKAFVRFLGSVLSVCEEGSPLLLNLKGSSSVTFKSMLRANVPGDSCLFSPSFGPTLLFLCYFIKSALHKA